MNSQLPSLAEQVRGLAAYAASLRGTAQSNSAARQSKHPAKLRAEALRRGILQVLSAGAQLNARQLAAALSAAGHSVALGKVERSTTYHHADALAALARTESIYKGEKFSDHAPLTVDYAFNL